MQNEVLEATTASGVGLRVEFVWQGDRFGHVVSLIDANGTVIKLLESVEGTANDPWPPSPPLQSLHLQMLPADRRAALLVGMAGRSHWSASIETAPSPRAIQFDIACRSSDSEAPLRSRYKLVANGAIAHLHEGPCEVTCEAGRLQIVAENGGELSLLGQEISVTASRQPLSRTPLPSPAATRRWKYQISHEPLARSLPSSL